MINTRAYYNNDFCTEPTPYDIMSADSLRIYPRNIKYAKNLDAGIPTKRDQSESILTPKLLADILHRFKGSH